MSSLRRFGATLFSLLLLQLTLLGSGSLCAMHEGASEGAVSAEHAGHTAVASVTANPADSDNAAPVACESPANDGNDCEAPWAPGQCASMTTCSTTVASPASVVVSVTLAHLVRNVGEPASIHSSTTAAPELPPPRV